MNLDVIQKEPEIGDYVFCCRWGDRSPSDHWRVGILESTTDFGKKYYRVEGHPRDYPHCQVITPLQGVLILGFYPSLEGTDWRSWNERISRLGDEEVINFFRWLLNPKDPTEED